MFSTRKPLVLASGSPRRKQYFQDLGVDFTIHTADIDERVEDGEHPAEFVQRMAKEKARAVVLQCRDKWVVAADTVVCIDEHIFGKPENVEDAVKMLLRLVGKEHAVMTGFCVRCAEAGVETAQTVVTNVKFSCFSEDIARAYVATGEPMDKAGAYGIQGQGAFLVERISGSYTSVVGLPLTEVVNLLCEYGVLVPVLSGGY